MSTLIASYNDLKTEVAGFVHRADLTSEVQTLILLGEKRIHREVRTPDMEVAYTGTIAAGVIAVPTDFLEWRVVYIDSNGANTLQPVALEELLKKYPTRSASGLPKFIARNATNFEFGPYPDSTYAVAGTYYKRPTTVSSSWNTLATANPDLYLYAALAATRAWLEDDPRIPIWEQAYIQTRDALNCEGVKQTISGAPLRVTPR
jgi:hypothetical protein